MKYANYFRTKEEPKYFYNMHSLPVPFCLYEYQLDSQKINLWLDCGSQTLTIAYPGIHICLKQNL